MSHHPLYHEPTPQEIREACEEIQSTWSESERRKRAGLTSVDFEWQPPDIPGPEFDR